MHTNFVITMFVSLLFSSCVSIKNYAPQSTVIVKNTINKTNKLEFNTYQNSVLNNAYAYIEESVVPKPVQKLPFWKMIKNPPILDSLKLALSIENMTSYFNSNGYFNNRIGYEVLRKHKKNFTKASVTYLVHFDKPFYVNDLNYSLQLDVLKQLKKTFKFNEEVLTEGEVFNYINLEASIKNIVQIHKEFGYFKIKTDDIKVELDTLLNKFNSKYKYVNVRFYYNENIDTNNLKQYFVKEVKFNSNYKISDSTSQNIVWNNFKNILYRKQNNIVKPKILWLFNSLNVNGFFTESAYQQNINNLYRLNIWNIINVKNDVFEDTLVLGKKYGQIGFQYFLEKASDYNFNVESGLSYNFFPLTYQDINFTNQNSWGVNLSSFFSIKNTFAKAIETKFTGRATLESFVTTSSFSLTTMDFNFDVNQHIPWLFPFNIYKTKHWILNSDYALGIRLTERLDFYTLKSLNAKLDWLIEQQKQKIQLDIKPLYASFILLNKSSRFIDNQNQNPFLKYGFNEGITAGISFAFNKYLDYSNSIHSSVFNFLIEESGSTWSSFISLSKYPVFQYVKALGILTHQIKSFKQSWHFRLKGGYGYSYGQDTIINISMPFFKQFFAGGPNSMRAWNSARLGLGSSASSDTTDFKDRYGDITLESNLEYRFNVLKINSVKIESCLFVDIGNVWNRQVLANESTNSVFKLNKLYHDLAVAAGTGIRIALSFIVIRIDIGVKIKDPKFNVLSEQFFNSSNLKFTNTAVQLGIGYPF